MKKFALILALLLAGCTTTTVSESEALRAINTAADKVQLSVTDHPDTIQSVGELLYTIDQVGTPHG